MQIRSLPQHFSVSYVVEDKWPFPSHKHTHYEMQYIIRGKGQHMINDHSYYFKTGDLFVLAPQDVHSFLFQGKCAICIIKFNERLFRNSMEDGNLRRLLAKIAAPNRRFTPVPDCGRNIASLVALIMKENKHPGPFKDLIVRNALSLLLALLADKDSFVPGHPRDERIQEILAYIDEHIADKELLTIEQIAAHFHITKTYFTEFFKRKTGSTYKKYIQTFALNLIAHRLVHKGQTVSQLAYEFGYSDESHLSHAFKAHFKQTPSVYKKNFRPG